MKKTIAIVHYSYPPVIGGVEFIIAGHASIMARKGCRVRIIAGAGESDAPGVEVRRIRGIAATGSETRAVQEELSGGDVSPRFDRMKSRLVREIGAALRGVDTCFIHNVMTMHFNLPLTAALAEIIAGGGPTRFYAWCHDATVLNPDYSLFDRKRYPWSLMIEMQRGARYIAISRLRQRQLSALFKAPRRSIRVVPDGMDVKSFLGMGDAIWTMALDFRLFDRDIVLFYPSRILRRKNYESAIRIVAALKKRGRKVALLLTGAPDPHNPATALYWRELTRLMRELGVTRNVISMYGLRKKYGDGFRIGYLELRNLYDLSDMLIFSSGQEGFGIPLLEAGAKRLPIACSTIPPFREIASGGALFFSLDEKPAETARRIVRHLAGQPAHGMFKRVMREYSWEAVYRNHLAALIR